MNKPEFEQLVRNHLLMYLLKNAGELGGKSYRVIKSAKDLLAYNEQIVKKAQETLFTTGSRCELFESHRTETSGRARVGSSPRALRRAAPSGAERPLAPTAQQAGPLAGSG
jgi:hypothetical protein